MEKKRKKVELIEPYLYFTKAKKKENECTYGCMDMDIRTKSTSYKKKSLRFKGIKNFLTSFCINYMWETFSILFFNKNFQLHDPSSFTTKENFL